MVAADAALPVHASQFRERFGAHQGRVARQNKSIFGAAAKRAARHQHGVAGSALRLLNDDLHTQRLKNGGNVLGLVSHHGNQSRAA